MKPSRILSRAIALLSQRGAWTTGAMARDRYGRQVEVHDKRAVCWCARGVIRAAALGGTPGKWYATADARWTAEKFLARAAGITDGRESYIVPWNDGLGRTKRQVLAAFKRAFKAAREAGQ